MSPLNFSYTPEISIILPTYNRANYLNDCINSVINQTFKDWVYIDHRYQ
ncbi:MAG: glycosyltransferase [Planktothrix sp.]